MAGWAFMLGQCASGHAGQPAGGEPASPSPQVAQVETVRSGTEAPTRGEAPWGEAVNGLRGRIVATSASIPASAQLEIALELQNVGSAPVVVQLASPFAFSATVREPSGAVIEATFVRGDVISSPRWVEIPPSGSTRYLVTQVTDPEDGAASSHIDLVTNAWALPPGRYQLSGRYALEDPLAGAPAGAWSGSLSVPPIDLAVGVPAGER